jgi:GDP-mannose 6-dehydrogenase
VFGVDISPDKVSMVNAGQSPVVETGLGELLTGVVGEGRLIATTDTAEAIGNSDVALVCVGTPSLPHGQPDVSAIERVGRAVGEALVGRTEPFTVVLRSTSLPGTTERVLGRAVLEGAGPAAPPHWLAMNPEFMREGSSLHDFWNPPFVVIGTNEPAPAAIVGELYSEIEAPLVHTSIANAELVKYVSNAFHGLKVCFANEMSELCDAFGTDPQEVMRIFALDRTLNISPAYLKPGFAFGGSCLPKDLRALLWAARDRHLNVPMLSAVLPSNEALIRRAADLVLSIKKRRIGVAGLAFKPGTDDLRESPIVALVEILIGKGCDVRLFDRHVSLAKLVGANRRFIETEIPHIASLLCDDLDQLIEHADVLVLGSASQDSARALAGARRDCAIVDLTRGMVGTVELGEGVDSSCGRSPLPQ